MDSFSFTNLQAEKANAILKHRNKLRRLANVLRFVEVCVVLVIVSRFSLQLPLAVKNSNNYFRDMSCFMKSPSFVFLIGNIIIIVLFAQSGQFSAQGSARNASESDMYQEFLRNSTKNQEKQNIETGDSIENQKVIEDHNKYPEKKSVTRNEDIINCRRINGNMAKYPENKGIYSSIKKHRIGGGSKKQSMKTGDVVDSGLNLEEKDYRRCQTQIISRDHSEKQSCSVLRRCDTENRREIMETGPKEQVAEISYPEDDMSNEEFRQTVEAFIARQQRLRREEEDNSLV